MSSRISTLIIANKPAVIDGTFKKYKTIFKSDNLNVNYVGP